MTFNPGIGAAAVLLLASIVPPAVDLVDGTEVRVVFLKISVKPLIIPSLKPSNLILASSNADAAVVELAPLVIPVKVVEDPIPVYVICSVPNIKVPEVGKPAVVSTVKSPAVAGLPADIAPFINVFGCCISLFRYECLLSSFKIILLLPK